MSTYKAVRGKTVSVGGHQLTVHPDGTLHVRVGDQHMELTEGEASTHYDLLGDVMAWDSSANATESEMERSGEASERSADDPRAAEAKH